MVRFPGDKSLQEQSEPPDMSLMSCYDPGDATQCDCHNSSRDVHTGQSWAGTNGQGEGGYQPEVYTGRECFAEDQEEERYSGGCRG